MPLYEYTIIAATDSYFVLIDINESDVYSTIAKSYYTKLKWQHTYYWNLYILLLI